MRKIILKRWKRNLRKPADGIWRRLPCIWKRYLTEKIKNILRGQYPESESQLEQRAEDFLRKETALLFWGMIFLFFLGAALLLFSYFHPSGLILERNHFGAGAKEIFLLLQKEEEKEEYSILLEERSLTKKQRETLYQNFFHDLEIHMKGENNSLKEVNQNLCFDETLEGYPFQIIYQPENITYIQLDGSLGEEIKQWEETKEKAEKRTAKLTVTAVYENYTKSKTYDLEFIPQEKEEKTTIFDDTIRMLENLEKKTRGLENVILPEKYGDVEIMSTEETNHIAGVIFLMAGALFGVPAYKYLSLKERGKRMRKETIQDFPLVVHLLTLYMGAGLSFASAIRRISFDYKNLKLGKENRYAFDQILWAERQMDMGVSQKEACMKWGKRFEETIYQKLSVTLTQTISKGAREGRVLMEKAEEEAFKRRIERVEKEGEEASTKLLFPMIVLLCLVMVLVMFPAVIRFYSI